MIETARAALTQAVNPVSFSGAGLSAESGIATFREPQTGLWARYDPMKLASPEGFAADPELVVAWYNDRRRRAAAAQPNAAHRALAARSDMVHIAQNVDDLLERAGAKDVVHLHGSLSRDRCNTCSHRETVDMADPPGLRDCPECGDRMRPDVVWFGESLPRADWTRAETAARAADVFVVIGTSATVYPAAGLIEVAYASGASIIVVNVEPGGSVPGIHLTGAAAEIVPQLLR